MTAALYYVREELENLMRTDRQKTENRQTDREFNYRGHSNPSWIVGMSGPITFLDIGYLLVLSIRRDYLYFYLSVRHISTPSKYGHIKV